MAQEPRSVRGMEESEAIRHLMSVRGLDEGQAYLCYALENGLSSGDVLDASHDDLDDDAVDLHGTHDQKSHGRKKRSGGRSQWMGVTPYRGATGKHGKLETLEDYRETTRYKGFINKMRDVAGKRGVEIEAIDPAIGTWMEDVEPAVQVRMKGEPDAIERLAKELGRGYNQDGVLIFDPLPEGGDIFYTFPGVNATEKALKTLHGEGFPAGTFRGGNLELVDIGGENPEGAANLAEKLGVTPKIMAGKARLLENHVDYAEELDPDGNALKRALAALTAKGIAARIDERQSETVSLVSFFGATKEEKGEEADLDAANESVANPFSGEAIDFHLPGQHNQSRHGRRGGKIARPKNWMRIHQQFSQAHSREFWEAIDEKGAFLAYKGPPYKMINGQLRAAKGDFDKLSPEVQEYVSALDKAFRDRPDFKQEKPVTVFRGFELWPDLENRYRDGTLKGYEYIDDGYGSTSISEELAHKWATQEIQSRDATGKPVAVAEIRIPPPPAGAYLEALWDKQEYELMLPRGVRYKVDDVYDRQDGTIGLVMSLDWEDPSTSDLAETMDMAREPIRDFPGLEKKETEKERRDRFIWREGDIREVPPRKKTPPSRKKPKKGSSDRSDANLANPFTWNYIDLHGTHNQKTHGRRGRIKMPPADTRAPIRRGVETPEIMREPPEDQDHHFLIFPFSPENNGFWVHDPPGAYTPFQKGIRDARAIDQITNEAGGFEGLVGDYEDGAVYVLDPEVDWPLPGEVAFIQRLYPEMHTLRWGSKRVPLREMGRDPLDGHLVTSDDLTPENIRPVVELAEKLVGRESTWNGKFFPTMDDSWGHNAAFDPQTGNILSTPGQPGEGLAVAIPHEVLHSVSNSSEFPEEASVGWEEGVVEQYNRLHRDDFVPALFPNLSEEERKRVQSHAYSDSLVHPYNDFIQPLERLRSQLGMDSEEYYKGLMQVPVDDRPDLVVTWAHQRLDKDDLDEFLITELPDAEYRMQYGRKADFSIDLSVEQEALIRQMLGPRNLDEVAAAKSASREWLEKHPGDRRVQLAANGMLRIELWLKADSSSRKKADASLLLNPFSDEAIDLHGTHNQKSHGRRKGRAGRKGHASFRDDVAEDMERTRVNRERGARDARAGRPPEEDDGTLSGLDYKKGYEEAAKEIRGTPIFEIEDSKGNDVEVFRRPMPGQPQQFLINTGTNNAYFWKPRHAYVEDPGPSQIADDLFEMGELDELDPFIGGRYEPNERRVVIKHSEYHSPDELGPNEMVADWFPDARTIRWFSKEGRFRGEGIVDIDVRDGMIVSQDEAFEIDQLRPEDGNDDDAAPVAPENGTARTGTPVSSRLMPASDVKSRGRMHLERALAAIDKVHTDGPLPNIEMLHVSTQQGEDASYDPITDPESPRIKLTFETAIPETSLIHEIGHFIDDKGLNPGVPFDPDYMLRSFASHNPDPFMNRVLDTLHHTDEAKRIRDNDTFDMFAIMTGQSFGQYLLSPHEVFARGYAQWVAKKSGDPVVGRMMEIQQEEDVSSPMPSQWTDESFRPAMEDFDELFRSRGWLKE